MSEIVPIVIEKAGGITALAASLGIRHNSIHSWKQVPANRVLDVERITGLSRHDIRPDIFGPVPARRVRLPKTRGSNAGVAAS